MKALYVLVLPVLAMMFPNQIPTTSPDVIDKYLAQYSPYEMKFDASGFSDKEKTLLKKLLQASEYLDTIYWLQTSTYGMHLRDSLENSEQATKLLTLVKRNGGPFELLNEYATFIGTQKYYPGDEFYPRGMTVEQFDSFVNDLPEVEKQRFMSPYSVIRDDGKGGYKAIPFHEEYKQYIGPIAQLLNDAADLSENESFAKFLRLKAKALQTDDYYDADVAWIDMEGSKFDIVFGPFETYADGIKGVKAKYEASIEVVDQEESKKLEVYKSYLKDMEENLPIPPEYKSEVKGLTAKFVIVRDIMRKGEAIVGYQAVATNLPNDPAVHEKKGTKKTFWKNMFAARFNTIIKPVSVRLIDPSQQQYLSDEGFFQVVLMHEICHAVGPRVVKVGPKKGTAANAAIGPNYSPLEEEKADIAGLHSLAMLIDKGVIDKNREREFYTSYLGSLFRSIRFGLNEAHGKAAAIELNYLVKQGSIMYAQSTRRWSIDFSKIRDGVKTLANEILILEGNGDGQKVQEFFDRWTMMTPELQTSLDAVKDIAIDVLPQYSITW
ncbi:MAG: hypothetical protein HY033_08680 [Ignavibacteriae bacterium]|nr:hypothetical protein [Ignavibacteria bacterium]MBI3364968.1 hypothetical protein [Ignavibacteriota bacterium]